MQIRKCYTSSRGRNNLVSGFMEMQSDLSLKMGKILEHFEMNKFSLPGNSALSEEVKSLGQPIKGLLKSAIGNRISIQEALNKGITETVLHC